LVQVLGEGLVRTALWAVRSTGRWSGPGWPRGGGPRYLLRAVTTLPLWKYLNVHELVAVGIKNKVFDRGVCYNFWGDALVRHAKETEAVIAYEIETSAPSAYLELRRLSVKWARRAQKWREKQAKRKTR
jgi:hypothetical protein